MYKRVALGKDNPMDVVAGESSGVSGQLALLYPLLFALQVWEVKDLIWMISSGPGL